MCFFCIVRLISTGFFLYKHSDFVFIVLLLRLRGLPDAVLLPRIKSPSNFDFFGGKLVFFCSPVAVKLPSAPLSLAAGRWGGGSHWKKSRPEPRPRPEIRKSHWCFFQRMFHQRTNQKKREMKSDHQNFRQRLCSSPNIQQWNNLTPDSMCRATLYHFGYFFFQGLKGRPGAMRFW